MTLSLKPQPDGCGFLYGDYIDGADQRHRIDIMPPAALWSGDFRPTNPPPHEMDWVIYCNGQELARVRQTTDFARVIAEQLAMTKT